MTGRNTNDWIAAELAYTNLHAERVMAIPGVRQSADETLDRMAEIVQEFPEFYPARLEYGIGCLISGADGAVEQIEEGIRLMFEHGDPNNIEDEVHILIENLENAWRFDVAKRCLEPLVERFPDKALFHDYFGFAAAQTRDFETALQHGSKAVTLAPHNSHFVSNLGLFHLMAGELDQAESHLNAALSLDPENEVVKGNLRIYAYATEHDGNFFDYFVRPPDREQMERLENEDDVESLDALCESYNHDRLEAFGQSLASDEHTRARCADVLDTLRSFFRFVHQVSNMLGILDEDISFLHRNFNPIMHKFIFKFRDADQEKVGEICDSLIEYFEFLSHRNLVSTEEFQRFHRMARSRKKELMKKAKRYGEVRRDARITEGEKETIREQLFEGDHCWPHL